MKTSAVQRPAHINRGGAIPFYFQLREILAADIGRAFKPGDMLPPEGDLCTQYGVSRTVVRQALDELSRDGMIYKLKGKGTFVTSRSADSSYVQDVAGFFSAMTSRGHTVTSQVLRQEVVPASAHVARMLAIDIGASVVAIDRVRSVDDTPLSVVRAWLPHNMVPGLESIDLTAISMYAVMRERYGQRPHRGTRSIEAIAISEEDAAHVGVPAGSPALRLESIARNEQDVPLEYYVSVYRGDRSKLEIQLVAQ